VTTALTFATSHPTSVDALFTEARHRGLRLITGKVLQDRHSARRRARRDRAEPDRHRGADPPVARRGPAGLRHHAALCAELQRAQLRGAGELAARYPEVWIQSHVAENLDEVRWARELFPASRSYLAIYDDHGLMRERAVYAHCIHFDDDDRALMRDTGTAAAVSPTSNLFLGSGFFDYAGAERVGFRYGLASDVGGGTSFSPFHTMLAAYYRGARGADQAGLSLSPQHLWWQHTAGAAQRAGPGRRGRQPAAGLRGRLHRAQPPATPLLARRTAQAQSWTSCCSP
jgi:guanine deaminase